MELIFLGASDKVECFDIGKQVKAQEFTQAAKCLDVAPQASITLNLEEAESVRITENIHKRLQIQLLICICHSKMTEWQM